VQSTEIIATADSAILDRAARWFNLAAEVLASMPPPPARIPIDLAPAVPDS